MKSNSTLLLMATCALLLSLPVARVVRAQSDVPKFEAGVQYSLLNFNTRTLARRRNESGFGGRFTFNFNKHIAAEAQVDFFPRKDIVRIGTIDEVEFGRKTLGVFGVKAGVRGQRVGVFGKARPGFVHFSDVPAIVCIAIFPSPCLLPAKTNFAFDVGGVVEYYLSRRGVARFDAGDTIIHHQRSFGATHNFQFSAGVGVRF